ncbi:hypothetical protein [Latilactobacillus sakei]|uniref:hypothetical protein n=1 Tax=Latilactobacillus sakei TaxID=1599 RepID=UPI000C13AB42|nr:hypothetical protein [Latilactobacillus sakei]RXA82552.1 hypothetical protein EQ835_01800 [Latilactobacillus sakei]UNC21938.1 hypothetical protein FXV74_08050 [Latilactobacillus sakei]UNC23787.1 hypothetical protein FX989_07790 [Latilactobacillus sakei]SOB38773.1 exported hypothetical protein [Latilactobacillus sakei]
MQIKRLIYVSLAAMMLSGSLINVPGQAWAAKSELATSVSGTEEETSTESIDVNTKKPATSEQAPTSRSAEPVGTPSNADKPSKDGWSF